MTGNFTGDLEDYLLVARGESQAAVDTKKEERNGGGRRTVY